MQTAVSTRIRLGAVALGLATFLLALFPLVRPFFPLDVFEPARGIALASPAFVSNAWTSSHYLAMLGFVLLQLGLLTLYGFHAGSGAEPLALRGLVWSLPGVALILPAFGVEAYTMPIVGQLHLAGATGLAPIISLTYRGPMTIVLLVGQLALAVGAFTLAVAIRRGAIRAISIGGHVEHVATRAHGCPGALSTRRGLRTCSAGRRGR